MLKHAFVNSCFSLLGLGQLFAGHPHEIGEIFMVVNVGDVKIVLRTWVGWVIPLDFFFLRKLASTSGTIPNAANCMDMVSSLKISQSTILVSPLTILSMCSSSVLPLISRVIDVSLPDPIGRM